MDNLRQYILSTFNYGIDVDAIQFSKNTKLRLLNKEKYYIYPTPIPFTNLKAKQDEYKNYIIKAAQAWSDALNNKIKFEVIDQMYGADIKVYWTKENIKYAGMQYLEENGNHKTLCTAIGLMDMNGNNYKSEDVYQIILHEFGHILGLGHSPDQNDVMFANWTHPDKPSKNDILVLNLIYSLGQKSYIESEKFIEEYISQNSKQKSDILDSDRNISLETENIGNIKKYNLLFQNIDVKYFKN